HGNTDDNACFMMGEKKIALMLFPEAVFTSFTQHAIADTNIGVEMFISIDAETRDEVDELAKNAVDAGADLFARPGEKDGWMYGCAFADLDGHRWNILYTDMSKMKQQPTAGNNDCVIIHATVNATANKVWDYYTKPEHITKWNNASEDWHTTKTENDLKTGGRFISRMEAKDGSMGFDFGGYYSHIKNLEDIAYSLDDSRKVNIHFEQTTDGIKITQSFEPKNENTPEMQQKEWQAILDNFKKYVENN
ncbi:MAG: SRPBCC domain-containing protein, partial [Ferruginibacter sp.]|nr:SRPBCC domain-containing protein [Ferruginibacter sp.]